MSSYALNGRYEAETHGNSLNYLHRVGNYDILCKNDGLHKSAYVGKVLIF